MVRLQEAQTQQTQDDASPDDTGAPVFFTKADIRAQVLGRNAGFISGVGPAPRKNYSRLLNQPTLSWLEFEDYKVEVKRLAQVVDQQAELIARLSAFLDARTLLYNPIIMTWILAEFDTMPSPWAFPGTDGGVVDDHCFLKDILEGADAYHLRNELLSQLVNDKNVVCTDTPAIGSRFIQDRLRYKKVFIFLDNLKGSSTKLKALFGEYHFAIGSRVIVTTRDVQLLRKVGAKTFELKGLSDFDALKLFCFHAFGQHLPATGYESLSKGIADYARGNPLALEVLGSSLNSKSVKEWESASNKLKTYLNPDIQNVLRISSDKLGDKGIQDIFVDTACFSTGEMLREYLESILNCTEHFDAAKGISALVDKSLQIEWQYPSRGAFLEKHDLLQQMGHRIVCDENKDLGIRNRLWKAKDVSQWQYPSIAAKDVRQWQCPSIGAFLEKHGLPLQTSKGIVCDENKDLGNHNRLRKAKDVSQRQYPSRGAFKEKHGLLPQTKESGKRNRLLKAKDVSQWQYPSVGAFLEKHGLPLQTAQGIVCDENKDLGNRNRLWKVNDVCRVLERNTGTSTIEGISLNLGDLEKDIKLSPTAFSKMYNLKFLKIMHSNGGGFHMVMKEYCKTAPPGYKSMPDSFDCGCKSIHIPDGLESFVSGEIKYFHWDLYPLKYLPCLNTENLVKLTMQQSQLELLWNDAQNLNKLQLLDMANCKNLEDGIEYLPINLRDLKMGGTAIRTLPESIRKLKYLTVLDLHHCKNLRKIPQISNHKEESPESIENLTELKCLDLNRGHKSEFLPSSPCELLHLQKLILAECSSLEELPPLPHGLKELNIANCERLKSIAELPSSISYLDADNCTSL
nr:disease resistance protein RUN1-like [Ziziphus jujuba var. spinosa]